MAPHRGRSTAVVIVRAPETGTQAAMKKERAQVEMSPFTVSSEETLMFTDAQMCKCQRGKLRDSRR